MWRALRAVGAQSFVAQPEPRSIGLYARGRQLVAGNFQFAGQLIEAPTTPIWDLAPQDAAFLAELHGFAWLDDLAALGNAAARTRAQDWLWGWIARYGTGKGPGWSPDLIARRLIRWTNHALFLLQGRDKATSDLFFHQLTAQTLFLSRRWPESAPGLPRIEALSGLISASLALNGLDRLVGPAVTALSDHCTRDIDAGGGIPTRNPEELLEVFTLLGWAERALTEAGRIPPKPLAEALERIAPALRLMRHADGGLARIHGGGRGAEGRLDQALAAAGIKPATQGGFGIAMGFARLQGARTSLIVDAAAPPEGRASTDAHASTLAFELTSGRRPVVVSCGSGRSFGAEWRQAGRATASHSTLALEGFSSSRLDPRGDILADRARVTLFRQGDDATGVHLHLAQDGWIATHGLTHRRDLHLSANGRTLTGSDTLLAEGHAANLRFERLLTRGGLTGVAFALRFHLHPDVDATLDMGGSAISLVLKSSEIWVFRHDGHARLSLEPSVYLEAGRLKPRPSRQIVLSGRAIGIETRLGWTLAKAQDTPLAIRDLDRDDLPVPL
jgi:uncharacterized heparinase superfamily protein